MEKGGKMDKRAIAKGACLIIFLLSALFAIAACFYLVYGLIMAWYTL
jgi:hypothetical protein